MTDAVNSDQLLQELDDSIPQGVPNSTRPAIDDDFAALDDLLSESLESINAKAQYDADLKARKRNFVGMSKEEVDFCNSRMAAFEAARIWEPQHAISVWQQFCCENCGNQRMVFSRYMEFHQSRSVATTNRWITVPSTKMEAMPVKEVRDVPTCPRCSEWELDPRLMTDLKEVLE